MEEICTSLKVGWVHDKDNFEITENFTKIMNFYVFGTPCDYTSSSWQSMRTRKWEKDVWSNTELKSYLMSFAELQNNFNYRKTVSLDEMSSAAVQISVHNSFQKKRDINRILFYNNRKQNDFLQILYYIRCSIAHGRFERYDDDGTIVYVFEAVKKKGEEYSARARMVLKEDTLVHWAAVIMGGHKELYSRVLLRQDSYKEKIIEYLKENSETTRKILVGLLPFKKTEANRFIDSLRDDNEIFYDKRNKTWVINTENS